MTIKLLRDSRITHKAGETIEVSPEEGYFLTSVGSAIEVAVNAPKIETADKLAKKTIRKKTKDE